MLLRNLLKLSTGAILAILVLLGCHTLYCDRPFAILVRDAETKAPIPGAEVQVADISGHVPKPATATAGSDGVARLKIDPTAELEYSVEVEAKDYLSEQKDVAVQTLREIAPVGPFKSVENGPPPLVVEMFAGPRPTIELVVPTGYRGVLRVEIRGREDAPNPPGQRLFTYTVPANGAVEAVGPPVFLHGLAPEIRARFVDGTPLSRDPKDNEVGLRWVRREGDDQLFMVGNRPEWADFCKSLEKYEPRGSGGSGGGHGGGSRRGNGMGFGGISGMGGRTGRSPGGY